MPRSLKPGARQAQQVLRGADLPLAQMIQLSESLIADRLFGYARKVIGRARQKSDALADPGLRLRLAQRHALATYKDPDLPADARLDQAIEILQSVENLRATTNQETLGLAGAIYKRKFEVAGQKHYLERSLGYYRRGHEIGVASDSGYTGINAAYVLDVLAHQEEEEAGGAGTSSSSADTRRTEAQRIRTDIVSWLTRATDQPGQQELISQYWYLVTVAEAFYGLQQYREALPYLKKAVDLPDVPDWKLESTARQLASIAHLQNGAGENADLDTDAWKVLYEAFGHNAAAIRSVFTGKIGLALSGGGFRASLYHIGVLAKLAELDLLRSVEVLSCVSGGSIIGAHYYLEVRHLLQSKPDSEITAEDYIRIIQRIERDFLKGVQRNVRMHVLAEWTTNLKMIFFRNYSRTMRAGELYESEIYSRVDDGEGSGERFLNKLKIQPADEAPHFSPRDRNWGRTAKVPILVVNATTLNTGHNWQFTASWMGEPPGAIDTEIDANYRLRRMHYHDAPGPYQNVRLGHAVAASACVPGLFEPLALDKLYPDRVVRLVDGGVHDNQGITGLLEQNCSVVLVSDASGQMDALDHPGNGALGVLLRSSGIFQARMREAAYHDLAARRRASLLKGLMFIHLKKGLDADPVDWIDCPDPWDASDDARPASQRGPLTSYGISKDLQRHLASIRTDLDSFSDTEAYALMTSGYRMASRELPQCFKDLPSPAGPAPHWRFLQIDEQMKKIPADPAVSRLLQVGAERFFKIWKLAPALRIASVVLAVGIVALLALFWSTWWPVPIISLTLGGLATIALLAAAGRIFGTATMRVVRYRKTLRDVLIGLGMAVGGFLLARIHLWIFDPWFLRAGKIDDIDTGQGSAGTTEHDVSPGRSKLKEPAIAPVGGAVRPDVPMNTPVKQIDT